MKAWPSILSADGVSILIVVQKTDIDSNQRRSINCYHLASNDTRPSVTRRVEGNMLDTEGEKKGIDFRKCAMLLSQTDQTTLISLWLLILSENSNKSKRLIWKTIISWTQHTDLPMNHWCIKTVFPFLVIFQEAICSATEQHCKGFMIAWFSLLQL